MIDADIIQKNKGLIGIYVLVMIIFYSLFVLGFIGPIGYEGSSVLDYFLFLNFLFALITLYFEQNKKIELDRDSIRELINHDIIYTLIGGFIGLFFIIWYFALQ